MQHLKILFSLFVINAFLAISTLNGQVLSPPVQDTSKITKVKINFSDFAEGYNENGQDVRKLLGNVELRQDSVFLSCDTAIVDITANNVVAMGEVIIQQGDSLNVFSDSLHYNGNKKIAKLYNDVVMENNDQKLFTDFLTYNLDKKAATYTDGAILTDGETQLQSKIGYYYLDANQAYFKEDVTIVDEDFELRADTLAFNTSTKVVTFLGPTRIDQGESKIYCEAGFYDIANEKAEFRQNAQYSKGTQTAEADLMIYDGAKDEVVLEGNAFFVDGDTEAKADKITFNQETNETTLSGNAFYEDDEQSITADVIVYNEETKKIVTNGNAVLINPPQYLEAENIDFDETTGLGVATGNVFWQDSAQQVIIRCDKADYIKEDDYLKAYGERTLLISILDEDSLFLTSDTLEYSRGVNFEQDSAKQFIAFKDVRMLKSDFQAVCDSLVFTQTDSTFYFYDDPIIWSDTTQFSADSIRMKMSDGKLDSIFLVEKSFIINSPDNYFYNQIKGRDIVALFSDNEVYEMDVYGNAESVYYLQDDFKAYVGVNKTVCSDMVVDFGDNKVEKIKCFPNPKANLMPMGKADHEALKLEGFNWRIGRRPLLFSDLF